LQYRVACRRITHRLLLAYILHYNDSMSDSLLLPDALPLAPDRGHGEIQSFRKRRGALRSQRAEMVTVAVRRVNLDRSKESRSTTSTPRNIFCCPTPRLFTADEHPRARLGAKWPLRLGETRSDRRSSHALSRRAGDARSYARIGERRFTVLPYTSDDIVFAKRLIDAGAATIIPGAPIGSGMEFRTRPTSAFCAR